MARPASSAWPTEFAHVGAADQPPCAPPFDEYVRSLGLEHRVRFGPLELVATAIELAEGVAPWLVSFCRRPLRARP
jgi:hypothetical protein